MSLTNTLAFRRFPVLLTFLGIPSILFWVTVFLLSILYKQSHQEILEKQLSEEVHNITHEFVDGPKSILNEAFEEFSRVQINPDSIRKTWQDFKEKFGERKVRVFLFDSMGSVVSIPGESAPAGIDKTFNFLRQPWETDVSSSSSLWEGVGEFLLEPDQICRIRAQEGSYQEIGFNDALKKNKVSGLFRWNSEAKPGFISGMLALVWDRDLQTEFLLGSLLRKRNEGAVKLGFYSSRGNHCVPFGISSETVMQIAEQSRTSGSDQFFFNGWVVNCARFGDFVLLFAMTLSVRFPIVFYLAAFLLFAVLSIWTVRISYQFFPDEEPAVESSTIRSERLDSSGLSTTRLRTKLQILFFFGTVFPLISTSTLGLLYLQEKKNEIVLSSRNEALKKLDHIDQEFDGVQQKRQLRYHRLSARFFRGEETYDSVIRELNQLRDEARLDDYFVVSSQSQMLAFSHSSQRNEYLWLVTQPQKVRIKFFKALLTFERLRFSLNEARCIMGQKDNKLLASGLVNKQTERLKRLLCKVGKECIDYSDENEGLRVLSGNSTSDLLVDEMVGNEGQASFRFLKLSVGQFIPAPRFVGEGYLYSNVFKDAKGKGQFAVFLFHDLPSLQRDYLLQVCSRQPTLPEDGIVRAYNQENSYSLVYPISESDPYSRVASRLTRSGRDTLVLHLGEGENEVYLVFRAAKLMNNLVLAHILPASSIYSILRVYQLRVAGLMLGVLVFCLTLGWILMERFLVPMQQLAAGVKAINQKEFSHRVSIHSIDELGKLGQTLNRTISYLGEMEVALTIQQTLFPEKTLRFGQLEIVGRNEMTQTIGGDFYDYFQLSEDRAVVLLGDVSGHGVSAALVTAMAKAGFHILFERFPDSPETVFELLNTQFFEILRRKKMMTCICGLVDLKTYSMRLCNAGQSFPVIVSREGKPALCELISSPLGVRSRGRFAHETVSLGCSGFVFYSDGLIEAENPEGKVFSYERFQKLSAEAIGQQKTSATEAVFRGVREFSGSVPWNDDATVVVVRVLL